MHDLLRENLESYLSGSLAPVDQQNLEAHLAECASCRSEAAQLNQTSNWLRQLRAPAQAAEWGPSPGFYARVMEGVDQEREVPFWATLVDPLFGRRVVFACLLLLAVLGVFVLAADQTDYVAVHRPEAVLAGTQLPLAAPHLGSNPIRNRDLVLTTLVDGAR